MSLNSNTQLVAPSSGGRELQLTPNATADNAVVSGTYFLSSIVFDNQDNAESSFLKLYDNAAPTVGTTVPDLVLRAVGGQKLQVSFYRDRPKFTSAISVCCVTAGGTAGSTSPTSAVSVGMIVQVSEDST